MIQNICNIHCATNRGLSKIIRIIMEIYIEVSAEARKQEFFRAGGVCWKERTLINICDQSFLLLDIPKIAF